MELLTAGVSPAAIAAARYGLRFIGYSMYILIVSPTWKSNASKKSCRQFPPELVVTLPHSLLCVAFLTYKLAVTVLSNPSFPLFPGNVFGGSNSVDKSCKP